MSQLSTIEWTDATWNPVRGCVKVSPGCANCYAETFAERWRDVPGHPYEQGFDLRLVPQKLFEPLTWKKPRRVFVNSMSDLFQDGVPDEYILQAFTVMAIAKRHTFQVLTKRPDRMQALLSSWRADDIYTYWHAFSGEPAEIYNYPLPNVWLGVSVENQRFADQRIPLLLDTPAAVRFISAEPLLGHVDIRPYMPNKLWNDLPSWKEPELDWVIVGGESGHGARTFDVAWGRALVEQCRAAGVPVFVKQLGSNPLQLDGDHVRFHSKKGGDMAEWPEDLRIREFPR